MQAYSFNGIKAKISKEMNRDSEKAGTIKFSEYINAAYLLDDEDIVIAISIFCNCTTKNLTLDSQINHTIEAIKIIQKTIELLSNVPQKESNMILEKIGLFDNTFAAGKRLKHINYAYEVKVVDRLLQFNISELDEN